MRSSTSDISDNAKRAIQENREKKEKGERAPSVIIAANIVIPTRQRILTDKQVIEILTTSDSIGITECSCRLSESFCDSPLETCILVGRCSPVGEAKERTKYCYLWILTPIRR
jgi:hypothetical protein